MRQTCARCGTSFEAKRATARYCGSSCRSLATRERKQDGLVEVATAPDMPSVLAAVRTELAAANRLDSVAGAAAQALAVRIDAQAETGAAVASLTRQLHATMAEALRDAPVADGLDELRARREARRLA